MSCSSATGLITVGFGCSVDSSLINDVGGKQRSVGIAQDGQRVFPQCSPVLSRNCGTHAAVDNFDEAQMNLPCVTVPSYTQRTNHLVRMYAQFTAWAGRVTVDYAALAFLLRQQ